MRLKINSYLHTRFWVHTQFCCVHTQICCAHTQFCCVHTQICCAHIMSAEFTPRIALHTQVCWFLAWFFLSTCMSYILTIRSPIWAAVFFYVLLGTSRTHPCAIILMIQRLDYLLELVIIRQDLFIAHLHVVYQVFSCNPEISILPCQ